MAEKEKNAQNTLLSVGKRKLSGREFRILRLVKNSFKPGPFNHFLQFLQRTIGQIWIHQATKNLRRVSGAERLRGLGTPGGILIVSNHRSFFDLYVITAELIRLGLKKRIVFPVRSSFFFDSYWGLIVNFLMSFLAMYPPLFRERKKAALNLLALDELALLLQQGNVLAGLHPEGTRKLDDDPYSFLPAQAGVGRVIQKAQVPVIPVFINGLSNNLKQQVRGNFNGTGKPIHLVFGEPIDFHDLLERKSSPKLHREISERCMTAIGLLAQEERRTREDA